MKNKDQHWLNNKVDDIRKRKRNLEMIDDPDLKKKIKKDLIVERRSVKHAEKNVSKKRIQDEINKYQSGDSNDELE